MKRLKINNFILIVFFAVFNYTAVYAWNDTVTHPGLTKSATTIKVNVGDEKPRIESFLCDNLGFANDLNEKLPYEGNQKTILQILQLGSEEEDAKDKDNRLSRSFNHFHNPLKATNEAGLDQSILLQGESALAWAQGTGEGCIDGDDVEQKCVGIGDGSI